MHNKRLLFHYLRTIPFDLLGYLIFGPIMLLVWLASPLLRFFLKKARITIKSTGP